MINTGATWDATQWGTWRDPIHKSDLNGIVGKFGCTEQFRRKKEERATGQRVYEKASGKLICGNATHAVIARILRSEPAREAALSGKITFSASTIERAFSEEYERERAGREVDWYRDNPTKWIGEQVALLTGLINDLHNHVGKVHLVEAGFIVHLDGIWLTGMTDLVYSPPGSDKIALADWKTGAQKPHQIELDHGWESGIYSHAVHSGWFIPGENIAPVEGVAHRDSVEAACIEIAGAWELLEINSKQETLPNFPTQAAFDALCQLYGARRFAEFPWRIRHVHLRDYIPYARATKKKLTRPEELEWAQLKKPETVSFQKGDTRGPGWLHVQRSVSDIPRLRHLLSAVVQWVRFGKFVAAPGEMCSRCKFREPCLNDGYQPTGEEKVRLDLAIEGLDFDGFDGIDDI